MEVKDHYSLGGIRQSTYCAGRLLLADCRRSIHSISSNFNDRFRQKWTFKVFQFVAAKKSASEWLLDY